MNVKTHVRGAGKVERRFPEPLRALWRKLLHLIWYVHPDVTLIVNASSYEILHTLATAAKPSMNRLHLRNIFQNGRRYQLNAVTEDTFSIMTTSKVMWHYRRRTGPSAIFYGRFNPQENNQTILYLSAHVRPTYMLSFALIPFYFTIVLMYMPWHPIFLVISLSALWIFSWFSHRYTAMLEAHEMVYFVHKALEDLIADPPKKLASDNSDVIYKQEFAEVWERFYEKHTPASQPEDKCPEETP